jgi:hypothetical protein
MDTDESFDSGMKAWSEVKRALEIILLWIQMKSYTEVKRELHTVLYSVGFRCNFTVDRGDDLHTVVYPFGYRCNFR